MCNDFSIDINNTNYNVDIGQEQDFTIEIEQIPEVIINLNEQGPMGPQGQPGQQGEVGNGIETILQTGTSGLEDTYTIYYTNGDTQNYTVTNGEKGDDGFSPLATITTTATGATITITDAEGTTTADITNGIDGEDGNAATIEVGTVSTGAAGTEATVVNSGTSSDAILDFTIPRGDKGETGETGNGISSVAQTGTSGLVDTYTIYYTNGNDTTFDVTNGQDGTDGQDGYSPTATVTQTTTGITLTITDKNGTTTGTVDTSGLQSQIGDIEDLIPNQASTSNQLADKAFVNSSIATNTAYFIGTFNSVAELEAYSGTLTNNDYAFVATTDTAGNTLYDRYKYNADTQEWIFEYELNNSSFTAVQWAAINSGITTSDVSLIQTALQSGDNITELVNNAGYITEITSSDITTALGYTPYDASNPNGYTSNTGTVTSVNNVSPISGNVTLSIPAAQVNSDWNAVSGVAQILNKPNLATVATSGSYNDLTNKPTIPSEVTESTVSDWGFTKNTGTVTSVNNVSPVNGNVSLTIPDTSNLANKDLSNLSSTGNSKFQAPLVSGTNIKTINNNSILGSGNLVLDGLPSQTGQSGKFLTTDGTDASWATVTIPTPTYDSANERITW